jgi:hypothetical protein
MLILVYSFCVALAASPHLCALRCSPVEKCGCWQQHGQIPPEFSRTPVLGQPYARYKML